MKVLLIVADALRADHLGCYGYSRPTSPNLDRLASSGTRFSRFFAANIPTQPAHTSIFSGWHGARHGVLVHKEPAAEPRPGTPWLPSILKDSGIRTAAFDNLADAKPWFARGWSEYHNLRANRSLLSAQDLNAELLPWLRGNRQGSWFCFVHYWDPHSPYLAPEAYRRRHYEGDRNAPHHHGLERWQAQPSFPFAYRWQVRHYPQFRDLDYVRGLYDAEISYLDDHLGELFSAIEGDQVTVVFTADHGEVMDDRPGFFDHAGLYDDTVRVPLVLAGPRIPQGLVVDSMHQHVDLAPTILRLFDLPVPACSGLVEGRAAVSRRRGSAGGRPPSATEGSSAEGVGSNPGAGGRGAVGGIATMDGEDLGEVMADPRRHRGYDAVYLAEGTWEVKWGIRTRDWKLIKVIDSGVHGTSEGELYHLRTDPRETENVITSHRAVVDRLELRLYRAWESMLGNYPDPLREQARRGVPAEEWVEAARAATG